MKNQMSTHTIWALMAVVVLLGVLYSAYYFNSVLGKEEPVSPVRRNYNVDVVKEMQATPNIFEKTIPLVEVPQSRDENTAYQPSELGKNDLTKFE